ncbi:MAG TPA: hypothetical protein VHQ45_02025 [Gemmatimonadaceae bacterium]|jgi:hypothetical protein|nr:hypothetical protein [Gemmatimonadaceae bacterium]
MNALMNRQRSRAGLLAALLVLLPAGLHAQQATPKAPALVRVAYGSVGSDSASRPVDVKIAGADPALQLKREVFRYGGGGRRDPFVSLMANGELRPMISDLRLVAVAYDPRGGGSVAIMRDLTTKEQYRARVGQTLGRMRVAEIGPRRVTFTIEEFGFSRQESLALGDSTSSRTQQ